MTTPAPQYDPNTFRRDSAPSDTQAIYIQEGGESHDSLFNSPSKHPKIFRLQEIMIVSALLCFLNGGKRIGLTFGLIFAILGAFIAIMSMIGNILNSQHYGLVPIYAGWFITNVLWIRSAFDPAVKELLV